MSTDTPTPDEQAWAEAVQVYAEMLGGDTPTPERVILTEGEMEALLTASTWDGGKCEHVDAEDLTAAVGTILAAREQALREEIAGEIEALSTLTSDSLVFLVPSQVREAAARIARGSR